MSAILALVVCWAESAVYAQSMAQDPAIAQDPASASALAPGITDPELGPPDEYGCRAGQRHLCITDIAFGFSIEEAIFSTPQGVRFNTVLRGIHMDILGVSVELGRIENLSFTGGAEKMDMGDLGMIRYRFGDREAGGYVGVTIASSRGNTRFGWPMLGLRLGHPRTAQWITELTLPSVAIYGNQGLRDIELRSRVSYPLGRRAWLQVRAKARRIFLPDDRYWAEDYEAREFMLSAGIRMAPRAPGPQRKAKAVEKGVWDFMPLYIGLGVRTGSESTDGSIAPPPSHGEGLWPDDWQFLFVFQAHVGMNDSYWLW